MLDSAHNMPALAGSPLVAKHREKSTVPATANESPTKIEFPQIDVDTIFWAARQSGFLFSELYCETSIETRFSSQDRLENVRLSVTPGAFLRCHGANGVRIFKTTSPSTENLLALLKSNVPSGREHRSATRFFAEPFEMHDPGVSIEDKFQSLSLLSRQLAAPEAAGATQFQYEERRRFFLLADTNDRLATGCDETASACARWMQIREGHPFDCRVELNRLSPAALLVDLQNPSCFKDSIETSSTGGERWPAPQGELPIFWSAQVFAKLNLHLIRAFEGDLFLSGRSFLTGPVSLPFHYQIEERPNPNLSSVDYEGSIRRPIAILLDGRPRGLACNRSVAEQLSVTPTGHSRRHAFHSTGTIGFWNPRIVPLRPCEDPLVQMNRGISVRDISVQQYSTTTGLIDLVLKEAYLVHNGEQGERIEAVRLRVNLPQLLQSCHQFSGVTESVGFKITKHGQEFVTEVEAPSALTLPLSIPGTVPQNHYW
jgi:predicted Zn-dependent protease